MAYYLYGYCNFTIQVVIVDTIKLYKNNGQVEDYSNNYLPGVWQVWNYVLILLGLYVKGNINFIL